MFEDEVPIPCRWCGSEKLAITRDGNDPFYVLCKECEARGPLWDEQTRTWNLTPTWAVRSWNQPDKTAKVSK